MRLLSAVLQLLLVASARAQQAALRTDPTEAAAVNAVLDKLGLTASPAWNIGGDLCTGAATDGTDIDTNDPSLNPAIKRECSGRNNTVCHVTKLKIYALDAVGPIPEELRNLTRLTSLNLLQNYITGPLPSFLGELTALQYLGLAMNALSGPVPKDLGNLRNLISLGLSSNNLNGSLPTELGNLVKLEQLYIDSTGLSGPLPSSFSKLTRMKTLWASDNDFTGHIPDYIGSWSNLTDLRFQGNCFQGPIPATLSNLVQMTTLRIGDIVSGSSSLAFISNMTSLNTLVLRNCHISDNLASVNFSLLSVLNLLDLSFNNITGQVPQALLNLNSLSFLFLGNNSLSGSLPSSIGSSLKNLDFSYNQLSGNFPSWASQNLQLNLVMNNFMINNSNSSVLLSGLECLQRDTPCFLGSPQSSSFAVACGSSSSISGSDNYTYQPDDAKLGAASYYVINNGAPTWGVSNVGKFMSGYTGVECRRRAAVEVLWPMDRAVDGGEGQPGPELGPGGSCGVHSWIEGVSGDGRRVSWFAPQNQGGGRRLKTPSRGGTGVGLGTDGGDGRRTASRAVRRPRRERRLGPRRGGGNLPVRGGFGGFLKTGQLPGFHGPPKTADRIVIHGGIAEKASSRRKKFRRRMRSCIYFWFCPYGHFSV